MMNFKQARQHLHLSLSYVSRTTNIPYERLQQIETGFRPTHAERQLLNTLYGLSNNPSNPELHISFRNLRTNDRICVQDLLMLQASLHK